MALALSSTKRPRNEDFGLNLEVKGEDWSKRRKIDDGHHDGALRDLSIYQRLVPAVDGPRTSLPTRRRVVRDGALSKITDIPLDIFEGICEHLSPRDLLHLSQVSLNLRRLLLSKSFASIIWIRSREASYLYSCPPDLTEPQLASLLFDNACHACGYQGPRKLKMCYTFRLRLCNSCLHTNFVHGFNFASQNFESEIAKDFTVYQLLPYFGSHNESNSWEQRFQPARFASKQLFLQSDLLDVVISYQQLQSDSEERKKFVEDKKHLAKTRIDDGAALAHQVTQMLAAQRIEKEEIAKLRRKKRREALEQTRSDRQAQILQKLMQRGHNGRCLTSYFDTASSQREWEALLNRYCKLTKKEWDEILPKLEEIILSRKDKWREHLHELLSLKRKWELQREFYAARQQWEFQYPQLKRLSFDDICQTSMGRAYLRQNPDIDTTCSGEWWRDLLFDMGQRHSEQVLILAACCRFLEVSVVEASHSSGVIHFNTDIYKHAVAFCWDCQSSGEIKTYTGNHLVDGCCFHGLPARQDSGPQVNLNSTDDLVPPIFSQPDLLNTAYSTSNPALIATGLLLSLNFPISSSMDYMDAHGNCFACMRCPPQKRITKTWRELVRHMVLENQKFVHARQTDARISKETIAHDVTIIGALATTMPEITSHDGQNPFAIDIWYGRFLCMLSETASAMPSMKM